jgi:hypothetical protein
MLNKCRPYDKNPRLASESTVKSQQQNLPNLPISPAKHGDDHSLPADQIDSDTEGDVPQDEEEEGEEDKADWLCGIFDLQEETEQELNAALVAIRAEASGSGSGLLEPIKIEPSLPPQTSGKHSLKKGKWSKDDAWTLVLLVQQWGKAWKAIGGELKRDPKVSL